ncbi:hypothetical protein L1987_18849 [Smallanthus sonchifolius]|uniref:Uncharacterized protein n=1 Tax=Smallanthus sonchifolius TaxID=185202 RepID=A0ACB9J0Q5_9ASTR|nr:hypothetical protein L1987_18849 [Smallanthus sonchifolius]
MIDEDEESKEGDWQRVLSKTRRVHDKVSTGTNALHVGEEIRGVNPNFNGNERSARRLWGTFQILQPWVEGKSSLPFVMETIFHHQSDKRILYYVRHRRTVEGANICGWHDELDDNDLEIVKNVGIVLLQKEIPDSIKI